MVNSKISIIVPVYNSEQYLSRCIDSVINQTYSDWELILVNDGSTDKSSEICSRYSANHQNIRLLNINRGGVSKARNVGLEAAKSPFVYFMDSDDYLSPAHLGLYASVMDAYDITFQGYRTFENTSGRTKAEYRLEEAEAHNEECMGLLCRIFGCGNIFGSAWSKLFRKDIIDRWHLRFKEDISIREDEIFTFEYCQYIKSVKVINSTSYNYRLTPNSLMRRKYYDPRKMLDVYNYSYQAALQSPLTDNFRKVIDQYYSDSLRWAFWMMYSPGQLADRLFRMHYYDILNAWDKDHPETRTRLIKINGCVTDYWELLKYGVKSIINQISC